MQTITADLYYLTEQDEPVVIERLALAHPGTADRHGRERHPGPFDGVRPGTRSRPRRRSKIHPRMNREYSLPV